MSPRGSGSARDAGGFYTRMTKNKERGFSSLLSGLQPSIIYPSARLSTTAAPIVYIPLSARRPRQQRAGTQNETEKSQQSRKTIRESCRRSLIIKGNNQRLLPHFLCWVQRGLETGEVWSPRHRQPRPEHSNPKETCPPTWWLRELHPGQT